MALYATVVLVGTMLPARCARRPCSSPTLAVLTYQWFVIRTALGYQRRRRLGLVVIDVLLSIALSRGLDGLLQPG